MVTPEDLVGRQMQGVTCSWFHARDGGGEPELLRMWLHMEDLGPVRFHTLDHILDLRIDEPHSSYDMDMLGHVTVSDSPDEFPLAPFAGSGVVSIQHIRQRSINSRVGFKVTFQVGSVRILALADDLVVTATRLPGGWEDDLVLDPPDTDPASEAMLRILAEQTQVCRAAREAVLTGGACRIGDGVVPAEVLADTYAVRLEHTRAANIETIGLPETVAALREQGTQPVQLGSIDSPDGSWHFVVFLAPDGSLVACTGVRKISPETTEDHGEDRS
ncbi:hypothetical protein [Kitasatospora purpeofusca]|uniref:Uncharacterized protein n=1 Tax=Kitasatospora purpeofusca TaxID=67352 RepID=A0ABZ1U292_9ACTN|nr:hypothetical protein [Kitasatospora purpeofusca]